MVVCGLCKFDIHGCNACGFPMVITLIVFFSLIRSLVFYFVNKSRIIYFTTHYYGFFFLVIKCAFGIDESCQFILLFNLFLLLFMDHIILFQLIFTFIYSTFSKKILNFIKINKSQTNPN